MMGGIRVIFSRGDFSSKGEVTLPQKSFKPKNDLREATLERRTVSVLRLVRSFATDKIKTPYYFIL